MLRLKRKVEISDEDLMSDYQSGDVGAFDLLLERHGASVLNFIKKLLNSNLRAAEDILQEVFIKVIEKKNTYESGRKFTTWLYTIARNRCIDYLRVEQKRKHTSLDYNPYKYGEEGFVLLDTIGDKSHNQEQNVMNDEIRKILDGGVESLKDEMREAFLLREIEDMSLTEIAAITGAPLSTVKSRLRYAYKSLRKRFVKAGYFKETRV